MFSFLTYDYKKIVMRIYRTRLLLLYFIGIIFICIFSVAMLVPAYMISLSRKAELTLELDALKKSLNLKKNTATESFVDEAGAKIEVSLLSGPKVYITDVIRDIVNYKNSDISIGDISLEKGKDGFKINLSGVALTRDGFLGFVKNLKSSDSLKSVDFPVGALAKDRNISFTLTLESIL